MNDIHGGDSRNERKDIRFNMVATSLFSFINMLSAQSDKMGTRNLFKKRKQDKTVQTSRDIARRHVARGLCVSMWLKQKISTSWISYCSKILHLFKSAQTNIKDAFLCFEFSVMDERNRNNPDMLRELSDTEVLYCERIEHCFVNIVALIILKLFLNLMRKLLYTLAPSRHVDVHRCASHLPFCERFIFLNSNKEIAYSS